MSLKIMVVDDEPGSLTMMRSLAAPFGHTVLTFKGSQQAGERAQKQRFDVAFVGMRMPQLDGPELTRRIRNSQPNRGTTIVMLSVTDDIESLRKDFGEGADFVLTPRAVCLSILRSPLRPALDGAESRPRVSGIGMRRLFRP